jgi:hypothetical protein
MRKRSSQRHRWRKRRQNLQKTALTSKVMNPFTPAPAPPFIGRRRDFYIPKVPSNLRNIPYVNSYMNIFYISYIYKPATSSHVEPGLLRKRLWLSFLLIRKPLIHRNPHAPKPPNIIFSRFPNFTDSWFKIFIDSWFQIFSGYIPNLLRFVTSGLHRFKIPDLHKFVTSGLHRFKIPDLHKFVTWRLHRFKIPDLHKFVTSRLRRFKIPDLHRINYLESSFHEFHQTRRFEGDWFFLNSPTIC